jgi:hypothetical protein
VTGFVYLVIFLVSWYYISRWLLRHLGSERFRRK